MSTWIEVAPGRLRHYSDEEAERIRARLDHARNMRGNIPTPQIAHDGIAPLRSMVNGETFDSKSAIRRHYRNNNVEEVGNDAPTSNPAIRPQGVRADLADALDKVRQGYKPTLGAEE